MNKASQHRSRRRARGAALTRVAASMLLAAELVGCGGAEPPKATAPAPMSPAEAPAAAPPPPPPPPEESEPRTIREAQERIARAQASLDAPGDDASAHSDKKQTSTPPKVEADRPQGQAAGTADACGSSCRALDSMRRAVEALCRMTGDTDARCVDARKTLADSGARVSSCRCGAVR